MKRHVVLISSLVMCGAIAAEIMLGWQVHRDEVTQAERKVQILATAVAEHSARSLQGADLTIRALRDRFEALHLATPAELRTRLAGEDVHRTLRNGVDFVPQIDAVAVVAADGRVVSSSRGWPVLPMSLADRDYFAVLSTRAGRGAFVSTPVRDRGTGRWTFHLAVRVDAPDGTFLGLVVAALALDYFNQFYRNLAVPSGTTVTLARSDGLVLASEPARIALGAVLSPGHRETPSAAVRMIEDGPNGSLLAVQSLDGYELRALVSIDCGVALANWRRIAAAILFAGIGTVVCFALLVVDQLRQFDRMERSETLLADRNVALVASEGALRRQAAELRESRVALAEQSATLREALRFMNQGLVMFGPDARLLVCNEHAARMLDLPPDFLAARPDFPAFAARGHAEGVLAGLAGPVAAAGPAEARTGPALSELLRPDGAVLEVTTVPIPEGGILLTYTDITARRHAEQRIGYMARHDQLTGLFNRSGFAERFDALLAEAKAFRHTLAVYYLDLDGFKLVNDAYGHATGDTLLTEVAERLRSAIRDTDVLARLGGDEFAIVQPFTGMEANLAGLARRMLAAVAAPYPIDGRTCSVNLSVGIALFPQHGSDAATLLHHADLALYRAKAEGKGTFRIFDGEADAGARSARSVEQDLVGALGRNEFHLEYQPIREAETLRVTRYEALLRWSHGTRGAVPAAEFIPVAERSGLMVPLGLWVLERACAEAMRWPDGVGVSVNISPVQLERRELAAEVEAVLGRTGLPPARLHLEVTEGIRLESTRIVLDNMERLRGHGIHFGLDDFGTAYAGLATLRSFTFDVLKIDGSFIREAALTAEAREVLESIRSVAAAFRVEMVAEGIETEDELELARALGCSYVQGYLLGRPRPEVEASA